MFLLTFYIYIKIEIIFNLGYYRVMIMESFDKILVGFVCALLFLGISVAVLDAKEKGEYHEADDVSLYNESWGRGEIRMQDSDYWDLNRNGKYDPEVDERMPDKLSDIEEYYIYGTDPYNPDSDGDGMLDGWEVFYMEWDSINKTFNPDPLIPDAGANPDGDGLDLSGTGVLNAHFSPTAEWDGGENFTNLEEYCGGSIDRIIEDAGRLLTSDKSKLLRDIASKGGFHLAENCVNPDAQDDCYFTYENYNSWQQRRNRNPVNVTTNPCSSDSDHDGMGDYYELYHGGKERSGMAWGGTEAWNGEMMAIYNESERDYDSYVYDFSLDPLDPSDADEDIDICRIHSYNHVPFGGRYILENLDIIHSNENYLGQKEFRPDGLTNLEEYLAGTDPLSWDTDGDTFERPDGSELEFHDGWELYGSPHPDPCNPDTDGDGMWDAWEVYYGLDPTNASDRFLDFDNDRLTNYEEIQLGTDIFIPDTDEDGCCDRDDLFPLDSERY